MNLLLCIGCDDYCHLRKLTGAERDARNIFEALTQPNQGYPLQFARLLLSPSVSEITDCLNELTSTGAPYDVITVFFAGHGAVRSGSFYFCTRESVAERLSVSAFPIAVLFQIVNELQATQVNIILDACEAGGTSFDLGTLCKTETIGAANSSSVAFLGACAADQYATETVDGGIVTTGVLRCLNGEHLVQDESPVLDLITLGTYLSPLIQEQQPSQKPILWGLSLFGRGYFAKNPHYASGNSERVFRLKAIPRHSPIENRIRRFSSQLWEEYRSIGDDPNPRRLLTLLETVGKNCGNIDEMAAFVIGVTETLSVRTKESKDCLATSHCFATGALSLLPHIETNEALSAVRHLLNLMSQEDRAACGEVQRAVDRRMHGLLNDAGIAADLYYLPLRISKLLGWIGASIVLDRLVSGVAFTDSVARFQLVRSVVKKHESALLCVSDEQAASLYVFVQACIACGEIEFARGVINQYYASFVERRGNVARVGISGERAFKYIISLTEQQSVANDWCPANPSYLLPILLASGIRLGCEEEWSLEALDHQNAAFFLPNDYRQFGRSVIGEGHNYTHKIGHGIWQLKEFALEWNKALADHFAKHPMNLPNEGIALIVLASQLFPDRAPLVIERLRDATDVAGGKGS